VTDSNVFQLSQPGTFSDPLTEVLRNGARALLSQAVEAEVATLLKRFLTSLSSTPRKTFMEPSTRPSSRWRSGPKVLTNDLVRRQDVIEERHIGSMIALSSTVPKVDPSRRTRPASSPLHRKSLVFTLI
jgi:hypothetical protein